MTSFETGVWQATYGACAAAGEEYTYAAAKANMAVLSVRHRAEFHWMPVREGHIPLPDAEDES